MLEIPRGFRVCYALLDQRCHDRQHLCPSHPGIRWSPDGYRVHVEFLDDWVETLRATIGHCWWPDDIYDTNGEPIPKNTAGYLSALGSMTPWDLDNATPPGPIRRVPHVDVSKPPRRQ